MFGGAGESGQTDDPESANVRIVVGVGFWFGQPVFGFDFFAITIGVPVNFIDQSSGIMSAYGGKAAVLRS